MFLYFLWEKAFSCHFGWLVSQSVLTLSWGVCLRKSRASKIFTLFYQIWSDLKKKFTFLKIWVYYFYVKIKSIKKLVKSNAKFKFELIFFSLQIIWTRYESWSTVKGRWADTPYPFWDRKKKYLLRHIWIYFSKIGKSIFYTMYRKTRERSRVFFYKVTPVYKNYAHIYLEI